MTTDVPRGWVATTLGDVVLEMGDGGTPQRDVEEYFGGSIPWVVIEDVRPRIHRTKDTLTDAGLRSSSAKLWPAGALILTTGASIGNVGMAEVSVSTKQGITGIVCDDGQVLSSFLFHALGSWSSLLNRLAQGSTFKEIRVPTLGRMRLLLPPLSEQRAIAAVLDSIDDAIERTEAVIAATERLRKALLHDLLTRGVPGWHSEWTEVPGLGTVPACWDVVRLRDECERVTKGTTPTTLGREYKTSGVRFLRVENISAAGRMEGGKPRFIDDQTHQTLSRSMLKEGDVVLSIAGALGRSALVSREMLPANTNQALAIIRLAGSARMTPPFLATLLQGRAVQRQVDGMRAELAQANISLQQVGSLLLSLPEEEEQDQIVSLVGAAQALADTISEELSRLTTLKAAAADALLTGRVRVAMAAEAAT